MNIAITKKIKTSIIVGAVLIVALVASFFLLNKPATASDVAPKVSDVTPVVPEQGTGVDEAAEKFVSEREAMTSIPAWFCVSADAGMSFFSETPDQERFASYATSRTALAGGGENVTFSTPECLMPITAEFAADGSFTPDEAFMNIIQERTAQVGFAGTTGDVDKVYSIQPVIISSNDAYPGVSLIMNGLVSENSADKDFMTADLLKEYGQADIDTLKTLTVEQLEKMNTALDKVK